MSRNFHEQFEVARVIEEARDMRRIVFRQDLKAEPGQFVMAWVPGSPERPLSVMNDSPLELVVKGKGGRFSEKILKAMPGQRIFIRGPYGNSFMRHVRQGSRKVLVCGGCGAVPLAFLAQRLKGEAVTVLIGAATKADLPGFFRGLDVKISTEDGSAGTQGTVVDLLQEVNLRREDTVFMCGPEKMMARAAESASRLVPESSIVMAIERHMKCGRGLCGACELDGMRVCVDGPVFTYSQLKGGSFGVTRRLMSGKRSPV